MLLIARQCNKCLAHCAIRAYSACCRSFGLSVEPSCPVTPIHSNYMYKSEQAKPTHFLNNCNEFPFSQHQHIDGHNFYFNKYQSLEKHIFLLTLYKIACNWSFSSSQRCQSLVSILFTSSACSQLHLCIICSTTVCIFVQQLYYMLFICLILLLLSWFCCLYCGSGAAAQGVKGAVTPPTMKHTGPSPQHDTHFCSF